MNRTTIFWLSFLFIFVTACQTETAQPPSAFEQGNAFAQAGALQEAKSAYETALLAAPTHLEIYRQLGIVEFQLGLYAAARTHLHHCISGNPKDGEASFFMAEILRSEERYLDAAGFYQKTLSVQPHHLLALQALTWCQLELHQYTAAMHTIKKAQQVSPHDVHNTLLLAHIWIEQHQEDKALVILKMPPASLSPELEALWESTRGKAQLGLKENLPAYHSFRTALEKSPLLASALLGIGTTYFRFGQVAEAKEYLELAIHVNPKLTEGYRLLSILLENSHPALAKKYQEIFVNRVHSR